MIRNAIIPGAIYMHIIVIVDFSIIKTGINDLSLRDQVA